MSAVGTYLNFDRNTEEAFNYYKSVFGGEFNGGIHRYSDMPPQEGMPEMSEADRKLVMHVELPIMGGHKLMGTDAVDSMGFKLNKGNNVYINLSPETKEETERLFNALSKGGKIEMGLQDTFWGAYFGSCEDKFGIHWMVNCMNK